MLPTRKNNLKYEDTNRRILKQWKEIYNGNSIQIQSHNTDSKVVIKAKNIIKGKKRSTYNDEKTSSRVDDNPKCFMT